MRRYKPAVSLIIGQITVWATPLSESKKVYIEITITHPKPVVES